MDSAKYYPERKDQQVEVADIGCGFGGLLFALAPRCPNTLILGKSRCFGIKWLEQI